jgi:hypothetical protein
VVDITGLVTESSRTQRIILWFEKNGYAIPIWGGTILNNIITLGVGALSCVLAISGTERLPHLFTLPSFYLVCIGITIVATISALIGDSRQRNKYATIEIKERTTNIENQILREKLDSYHLMQKDLIEFILFHLANDILKLETTDRISVFIWKDNNFERLGRYSKNPEFRIIGRATYPVAEGCLHLAWVNGHHFQDQIPFPNSKRQTQRWINYHRDHYNMPPSTSEKLNMKSCWYYSIRIDNDKNNDVPLGVLVIESTNPTRFRKDEIDIVIANHTSEFDRLKDIVVIMNHSQTPQ